MIKMNFKEPIFILNPSRSGTTILYRLFAAHRDTAYFERYSAKLYKHPNLLRLIPLLLKYQKLRYKTIRPIASEGVIWGKFFSPIENLDESNATEKVKNYYYNAIKIQLKAFNATRFVSKNPRSCMRVRWIDAMFPNAVYIVVKRDKKAIISSMYRKLQLKEKIWRKQFPNTSKTFVGSYAIIREKLGEGISDMEACIGYHDLYQKSLDKDLHVISDKAITVHYEDYVKDPRSTIKKLYEFTNLEWYDELEEFIPKQLKLGNNEKWKSLPEDEKKIMLEYIEKIKKPNK